MIKRIAAIAIFAGALIAALLFSQHRKEPFKVSGFVEAYEIRVGSRVGGRVASVAVREGDVVTSGAVLLELEPYDLLAKRAQTSGQLANAKAVLAKLEAGYRPEEIAQARARRDQLAAHLAELVAGPRPQEIAAARAQTDVASATLRLAQREFSRTSDLRNSQINSQSQMDQSTQNVQAASAELRSREANLKLLEIGTRPEEIAQARAQLDEAEAALKLQESGNRSEDIDQARAAVQSAEAALAAIDLQVGELKVRAPLDGRIEAVDLKPGDLISAGAPTLSMMDLSELWVRAYVPEDRLDIKVGQKVWITVDSFPDRRFAAKISFVSRQAEFTPGNVQTADDRARQVFRIKATLEQGLGTLRPGMAADVWLKEVPPGTTEPSP